MSVGLLNIHTYTKDREKRMAETYRPLPDSLTIMPSKIEGLGLFAVKELSKDVSLGETHIFNRGRENEPIRTPLGGFINHSDTPNCVLFGMDDINYLVPKRDIEPLEELTVKYTMYKV